MRALDKYLLEIPKILMDEITLSNDIKLYMDTSYEPEWKVCSSAFVKYVPQHIKNVSVGDEVAISYSVIADRDFLEPQECFHEITEGSQYFERYKSSKGRWLTKRALPLPNNGGIRWIAFLQDEHMNHLGGAEGKQGDVERWLSQFAFGSGENYVYNNLVQIGKEQLWKTEDFNIFAKRVGDNIVSVSDRVICKPIEIDLTTRYNIENNQVLPPYSVVGMYTDRAKVISGSGILDLNRNDVVGFEPKYCEKYTLWGMECFLIKEDRIDVTWQSENHSSPTKIIKNGN